MKNIFAAISALVLAGLLSVKNLEIIQGVTAENIIAASSNIELMVIVFLVLLSLFLMLSRTSVNQNSEKPSPNPHVDTVSNANSSASVLYFLSLLQEKGRLLDFVMDDVAPYSDEQVGQVARVVHKGVREVLDETVRIETLHKGQEGDSISIDEDYNAQRYRFVGNLKEKPPVSGRVLHRGWKAVKVSLPKSSVETDVVHPVEVEIS